jgi:polyisoprenoid-binding protein YceI
MKSLRLLLLAVCLATLSATAKAGDSFKIEPSHSTIAFRVGHMLGAAKGKFTKFNGTIEVDREHPEQSSVNVTIQAASINTAIVKRDDHLRSPEFFNVEKFPEITFKSRGVKKTGAATGDIMGDLTMHGVTRPVTLHVQLQGDPQAAMKSQTSHWRVTTAPIRRSQFGLVFSRSAETVSGIADEVSVDIEIEAQRAK